MPAILILTLAKQLVGILTGVQELVSVTVFIYLMFFMLWLAFGEALMMLLKRSRWFKWKG